MGKNCIAFGGDAVAVGVEGHVSVLQLAVVGQRVCIRNRRGTHPQHSTFAREVTPWILFFIIDTKFIRHRPGGRKSRAVQRD